MDICFGMNVSSQFMNDPLHAHWVASKQILRYLHGTFKLGLRYYAADV